MKKELVLILGNTGSGKSTLAKSLKWVHGYDLIVPFTTRPPREGEVDNVDYVFVTQAFFDDFGGIFDGLSKYAGNSYGIRINRDVQKQVVVCDATMYETIMKNIFIKEDFNITTVWLNPDKDVLLYRCMLRGDDKAISESRIDENGLELEGLFGIYRPDLIFTTSMHIKDIARTITYTVDDPMIKSLSKGFNGNNNVEIGKFTYDLTLSLLEKSKRKGDN